MRINTKETSEVFIGKSATFRMKTDLLHSFIHSFPKNWLNLIANNNVLYFKPVQYTDSLLKTTHMLIECTCIKTGWYFMENAVLSDYLGSLQYAYFVLVTCTAQYNDDRWLNAPGVFRKASETFFIISDLYRVVTEIAEVHADIARSFLKCIIPLLP